MSTLDELFALTPSDYNVSGNELVYVGADGGEDYAVTVDKIRGVTAATYFVTSTAEAMALSTALQSLPYMNEKAVVASATLVISGNEITGGDVFSGDQVGGTIDPKEAYNDQFIAFRLNGTSNFTRWFKVRRVKQVGGQDDTLFLYEDVPAGTYDGYKIGTLIWREVHFAAAEYNLDGFRCIPGIILVGDKGARIVELQSGQQNPIVDVGENMIFNMTFAPNQAWDALDGLWQARANQWAGTRFIVNGCRVRHGGMGNDHSGGPMSVPIFDGGVTIIRDCDFLTSRYMVGYRNPTSDIVNPIQQTRLIFEDSSFERVGEMAADTDQLFPCQVFAPPNTDLLIIGCTFFWDSDYFDGGGPRSCVLAGDISSVVGPENGISENANVLISASRFDIDQLAGSLSLTDLNLPTAIRNAWATCRMNVIGAVIRHRQPAAKPASVAAIVCDSNSETIIGSTRIFTNSVGVSATGGGNIELGNGTIIEVESTDANATCLNAVTTNGLLEFSNCVLRVLDQGRAVNALLANLNIGNNVEFIGSVTNTSNTVVTPYRGEVVLGGTGTDTVTVPDAERMNELQTLTLYRLTAGGTQAFLSIANRDDAAGTFDIVSAAGDTSTVGWWLHT